MLERRFMNGLPLVRGGVWTAAFLVIAAGLPAQDAPAPLAAFRLEALAGTTVAGAPVRLMLTVSNTGSVPLPALDRRMLVGPRHFLVAELSRPNPDAERASAWAQVVGEVAAGPGVVLHPGESFGVPVTLTIPEQFSAPGMQAFFQWITLDGPFENTRSNEVPVSIRTGTSPLVTFVTSMGPVVLELWPDKAPNHVANLLHLARDGYYDGTLIHRVVPGLVVQGGSPDGRGEGGPGYSIPAEFNDTPFRKGVLGMARTTDPDSAGSQWFICLSDYPDWNGKYTAFGRVIEGLDNVEAIGKVPVQGEKPITPVTLTSVDVQMPREYELPAKVAKTGESGDKPPESGDEAGGGEGGAEGDGGS
jgi:peptidyl-prolyl cis-trans isomerase B (cyclophilin B)